MPVFMTIEPVNTCNLKCQHCVVGTGKMIRPVKSMDYNLFKRTIDETEKHIIYLMLYFQGEPFLHKQIIDMIKYASEKKIYTITSTNAQNIDLTLATEIVMSGLNEIIISLDGFTQATYSIYRKGGNIDNVFNAINFINMAKSILKSSFPLIHIQFIAFKHNENEVKEIRKFKKKFKIQKLTIKTAQILNFDDAEKWIPENLKYSRYKKVNEKWKLKRNKKNCFRLWTHIVVCSNGTIIPCCYDKNASIILGKVDDGINEVWKNQNYNELRKAILINKLPELCNICY